MIKQITYSVLVATSIILSASCRQKDPPVVPIVPVDTTKTDTTGKGTIKIEMANKAGSSDLALGSQTYTNENGDAFTVSKFNYYLSNIKLANINSSTYRDSNGYHLVQQDQSSTMKFDLANVPYGTYNAITLMIGVDSARNVDGAQTGDLDPIKGMFWSWSTGYIMMKFEGNSPQSSGPGGMFQIHCGGFTGANNVLRTITLTLPNTITVNKTTNPRISIDADILKMLKSPNLVKFATTNMVMMPGADAKKVADNYAGMFTVTYAGL